MSTVQKHTTPTLKCYHCGSECNDFHLELDEKSFCCEGCKTVYSILNSNGLCTYYDLEKNPGLTIKNKNFENRFDYLENQDVFEKLVDFHDGSIARISFYIPSIHCASCIWLLENLYKLKPGIAESEVNFLKKTAMISFRPGEISLREVVEVLATIGYEPEIRLNDIEKPQKSAIDRSMIYKLGVAGFAFGNIMLFSFPEYFHLSDVIDPGFRSFFGYMNLLLSLPVLLYSGSGYFISAWNGLKHKIINIDFPVSLGILIIFFRSAYEIIFLHGGGYMDALAGLIFLLLVGKWFQDKTYDALSFERDYKSYFPISIIRVIENRKEPARLDELKSGDIIELRNGELIPADGILVEGNAAVDYSFVTGESVPVTRHVGEKLFAGGRQTGGIIQIALLKSVSQSYLTQLWNREVFSKKTTLNLTTRVNKVSKYFTITVLSLALLTGIYWMFQDPDKAVNAFSAVLIITCPCALALTVPFTFGNTIRIFGRNQLYLKKSDVVEDLSKTDTIVLDKTGTITAPDSNTIVYEGTALSEEEITIVRAMASSSTHPLSKAIVACYPAPQEHFGLTVHEISGAGLESVAGGHTYRLGSDCFTTGNPKQDGDFKESAVYFSVNGILKGKFRIQNTYRKGIAEMVSALKQNYEIHILSGDNDAEQKRLTEIFGNTTPLVFNQTPELKLEYIHQLQQSGRKVLMIGDGLNDAGALKQADVGLAVSEASGSFFPACDGMLRSDELYRLPDFLAQAQQAMKTTRLSFIISFIYNLVGISFAVRGELLPVIAAILMPLSSVSVIAFTVFRTNLTGRKLRL